jgi:hypothetical protein
LPIEAMVRAAPAGQVLPGEKWCHFSINSRRERDRTGAFRREPASLLSRDRWFQVWNFQMWDFHERQFLSRGGNVEKVAANRGTA